ncbi:MAG: peptidylprolyl isomerase [Candidatus Omnitrophota bacterium]
MIFAKQVKAVLTAAVFAFTAHSACVAVAEVVDKVVAVVNDEVVTQREFDRIFMPVKNRYEANFKGEELDKRIEQARKGILEQLINSKLAISLAKKENIQIDEAELQEKINTIKGYYKTEEEFLQELSDKGTNLTEFEREMRDQMLAQKLVEKEVSSGIDITPAEIRDLYEKNKDKLISPPQIKVRGIMVKKSGEGDETEAKKKIQSIAAELDKGRDFAEVAKELSEGPYAENGGDMGYLSKGQTVPEIEDALFSLKKDERTGVVDTKFGYHIFLVEEIQEERPLELSEVSEFLKQQLYGRTFQEKLYKWLEEKRKSAYISYK